MLADYWLEKDKYTGETWLSFAQRTGMDAASIAFGQAWQEHIDALRQDQPKASRPANRQQSASPVPTR